MSNSLKISGQTFPHREAIKRMGGKFDGVSKTWTVPNTPGNRLQAEGWSGVTVSEGTTEYKPPLSPNESNFQKAFAGAAAIKAAAAPSHKRIGNVSVYGESEQYLHYFQNAEAFAGFDSLEALTSYVEKLPTFIQERSSAWNTNLETIKRTDTHTMYEAIGLTRNGWQAGIDMAKKVAERITGQMPLRRKRVHSVAGGSVNVGRMLSGNPLHMRQRVKLPSSKVITLINNTGFRAAVSAEAIAIRAAVVAAIADTLENNGYACEIVSISKASFKTITVVKGNSSEWVYDPRHVVTATKLKAAGDRLNLSDVMFGVGHPSMHRRFQFALRGTFEEFRPAWKNMGASLDVEIDEPNTFVIRNLPFEFKFAKNATFDQKIAAIVAKIVPENLPLEFKFHADS